MKKLFTLIISGVLLAAYVQTSAQCVIDMGNTQFISPATLPCIDSGLNYETTIQIHPPASEVVSGFTVTIDSVHIISINGLPSTISYTPNPTSGTIPGGGYGCVWVTGLTNNPTGNYSDTINVRLYVTVLGSPQTVDTSVVNAYSICAPSPPPVAIFAATPDSGCAPLSVQFTDGSTNSPTSWSWTFTGGTPSTSSVQNPTVVFNNGGLWSAKLVATNSVGSDSITSTVLAYAIPADSITASTPATDTMHDGAVTITGVHGLAPYTYLWFNDSTGTSLSALAAGNYAVTITDSHGCASQGDTVTISSVSGIIAIGNNLVNIYPNPATDVLNLSWGQLPNAQLAIYDLGGKLVQTIAAVTNRNNVIDIHQLTSGAYILRITDKQTNQQQSVLFNKQ